MRHHTTLLLALAMLIAPVGTVAAQQGEETTYETEVEDDRATITFEQEIGEREVSNEISFDTDEGAFSDAFSYENATSEAEAELEVQLHQLVEYEDANGDGRYDAGDEVASAYKVANGSENVTGVNNGTLEWDALSSRNETTASGDDVTVIHGEARIPVDDPLADVLDRLGQGENRTFAVDIYVTDRPVTVDGMTVQPMEVKIDWRVTNYPYTKNGTALALVAETSSESEIELEDDAEASRAAVSRTLEGIQVDVAFSWNDEATVDGETTTVQTTTLSEETESESEDGEAETETERLLAFSYERGDEIVHDPTLGARTASVDGGLIGNAGDRLDSVPGLTTWAALLGIVSAALVVRTRR